MYEIKNVTGMASAACFFYRIELASLFLNEANKMGCSQNEEGSEGNVEKWECAMTANWMLGSYDIHLFYP